MVNGLSSGQFGPPVYAVALEQHDAYIDALRYCGLAVTVLDPDEAHPDSTFVEDTALVTSAFALITRPGAPSRRGETHAISAALRPFRAQMYWVESPGTLDAGDILPVNGHHFIGLSTRTNAEGADHVVHLLNSHGMTGSTIPLKEMLHLKSGVACLENGNIVVAGELRGRAEWSAYNEIAVDDDEQYAANCLWVNGTVLVAAGFPKIKRTIEKLGYPTIALEMSEFQKLDGGLSCLSLRF